MSLTAEDIKILLQKHKTPESALNAIVQLIGGKGITSDSPIFVNESQGQSTILNVSAGLSGSIGVNSKPTLIMNTGSTNILINGEAIAPGISFSFEGAFTYNSQASSILIITTD